MQGQRAVHHSWKSDSRYVCSKEKPGPRSLCFQAMKRSNSAHFSKAVSSLLKYLIERYCLTVGKAANPWKFRAEVKSLPLAGWPGCIGVFTVKPEQACGDARYLVSQLAVILKDQKKKWSQESLTNHPFVCPKTWVPSSQCWALLCLCSCCFSARRQKPSALEHSLLWKYFSSYVCSKTVSATMTLKVSYLKKKKKLKKWKCLLKQNPLQCPVDDALLWLGGLNPSVCPFSFWAVRLLATCVLFLFLSLPPYWWGWSSLLVSVWLSYQKSHCAAREPGPGVFHCPMLCEKVKEATNLIWLLFSTCCSFSKKRRGFPDPPEWCPSHWRMAAPGLLVEN